MVPGLSLCQAHKVTAATEKDYTEVFAEVQEFSASLPDFTWDSATSVDFMLVKLLDDRLLDGVHAGWSGKAFSAIGYYLPEFALAGVKLFPRAKAAQAGWKKLTPSHRRLPVTFELMCRIVHPLWGAMGRVESALVVLVCFSLYLRPGEPHKIRCRHIVAPMKSPSGSKHVTGNGL